MIAFEYYFRFREGCGFKPVLSTEEEREMSIQLAAPNKATADRMIKALINSDVIEDKDGVAIGEVDEY